jgi:DNA-binding winged helix-turn-helix (wHTH) protein/tetratricopeptide (TPR) repeat protein/TolB-like protein
MANKAMKPEGIFRFGEFQIDALARTLRREKEFVTLNRRAFDVLLYLARNPGRVVTREELLKNAWPDTFVDENSLAQSVSALRRALEEKPGDNSYVVTLPGRGYQFVSPVQVIAPENLAVVPDAAPVAGPGPGGMIFQQQTIRTSVITEEKQPLSLPAPRNRSLMRLIAVLAVAATGVAGIYGWKRLHRALPLTNQAVIGTTLTPAVPRRSIAVLGFRNLSGRPEEGWISTALAEMLSTELEAGEKLRLVSGEDIARTKLDLPLADADSLSRDTLARLHEDLDSDLIVLGSYTAVGEKPGTRIRLDLRLQDTAVGETIADVAVVGSEADLLDMVSQAGSRLREKLGVEEVSPVESVSVRASLPSNRDAARLYSEGLARLRVLDALGARDLLQQAVAADPKFSLAHSALAEAWSRLGYDKEARQESKQAYDLSANLSREDKLVVEGRYRYVDHEYEKAIEVYRALFALFPDNDDYGRQLATTQTRAGKGQDALATVELLRKLPPPASDDPRIEIAEAEAWAVSADTRHEEQPLARAVEKAKAQGSREILAEARQMQCRMFSGLVEVQKAVSACREARDIFAADGDREHEGRALITLAQLSSQTDVPEAIRLFQQAQTIFRQNGSAIGLAQVLDNLALAYDRQDDPATGEKMARESVTLWRRLGDTRNLSLAISNLAGMLMDQGDLRGASKLYEESLQVGQYNADRGIAALTGLNIATIHQLQGDSAGAKQGFERSLATYDKRADQWFGSPYALLGLGSLLLQGADFSGARKMYEQALALRTPRGDKIPIAESQLALVDLSLEDARSPAEQEAAVRRTLEVFQTQKIRDDETQAWCLLARALAAEGKAGDAKDAMQHARSLAAKSQNPTIRWPTAITAARIATAESNPRQVATGNAARQELAAIITKSREMGYMGIELDARLALAEIEMKTGQAAAGRAHLAAVEADAKGKGYNLIARKAATARS